MLARLGNFGFDPQPSLMRRYHLLLGALALHGRCARFVHPAYYRYGIFGQPRMSVWSPRRLDEHTSSEGAQRVYCSRPIRVAVMPVSYSASI